ncbi:DUF1120 domain-containing protein [Serratia fonticola]|uniref:DUF1120 domain-containing protein n=1 Tax=Serratia fonticola TaxID=47917 RepID=UPI0003AC6A9A|nr:DUF1120 domain-containing protein [Serratia fonticola]ERK08932.1 Beta-fimbriae putative major subunit [Serratia fonticola AU-P3(3)]MEB7883687.1 DUF1120 domain-containing protein [Serratia fonticola]
MKKNLLTLTAVSSLLLSAATLASENAEIKVIGEITTASCEVTMGNNGVFDFGKISQAQLSESTNTLLGSSSEGSVHVKCSAPTPLTFTTTDNRLGTATFRSGGRNFGLGYVNGSGKLGFYHLQLREPTVDGVASRMFTASESGTVGMTFNTVDLEYGKRVGWAPASGAQEMAIGKDFAFRMSAKAYLSAKSAMNGDLGEDVNLDGSATMEFGFGL